MKVEYVGPFAEAAYETLTQILDGVTVKRGRLSLKRPPVMSSGVVSVIGLAGEIEGRVVFDLDVKTAIKIAELMNYQEFAEFDDLARSTISELGNIIAGRAVSVLNDRGFVFQITPPTLFIGNQIEIVDRGLDVLVIPLEMNIGNLMVNVALRSAKK